jgi:hypothetical protein
MKRRLRRWRSAQPVVVEGGVVSIDGHDVTRAIRTPEIDKAATGVARLPACARCSSPGSARWAPMVAW